MRRSADALILELARQAAPVRRLAPPMARAALWLAAIAALGALAVWKLADLPAFLHRASHPRLALELAATLATGLAGVIAAFHLSLPDRSRAWAFLPLPFAVAWLMLSGMGCWRYWGEQTAQGWRLGETSDCFLFLLSVGAPMAGLLLLALRRARPLDPQRVALVAAAGVAGLTGFLLQFFHDFDITALDLGIHLLALAILVVVFGLSGRRTLEP